jgi:phosphoglycerol transferase MdoB-like AlkP superfamily enzyme
MHHTYYTFSSRYAQRWVLILRVLLVQLALWSVLRVVLFALFGAGTIGTSQLAGILIVGVLFDVMAGVTALLPLVVFVSVFRARWLNRSALRLTLYATAAFVLCFDVFVQFFFFEEYSARYNHLALDYLMYPDEVFGNIFASYNVPLFVGIAAVMAAGLTWWHATRPVPSFDTWTWRDRLFGSIAALGLTLGLWTAWTLAPFDARSNRVAGELALNGWAELVRACMTSHLDYEAYYASVPTTDARTRLSRMLDRSVTTSGLTRHFSPRGRAAGNPLDVVIIMEESLGSSFSARFGRDTEEPVTPGLDRWSSEGLAFTNLIANGNRTVRGMEGILCSFPPLPGDSIVKRDQSENVASIGRVLASQGYTTTFFTGGYGLFDNVKTFMTTNGFQEFVEQPDYPPDAFRTVWGVADEFVLDANDRAAQSGAAPRRAVVRHWDHRIQPQAVQGAAWTSELARR